MPKSEILVGRAVSTAGANLASRPILNSELRGRKAHVGSSLAELVGNTPLLRLYGMSAALPNVEFHAKVEWFNPGGSVKDRAALAMIREGERSGELMQGKTILDATSGNTGIAFAVLGAALGYSVTLCIPASASLERLRTLRALGAELILTPGEDGSDGAIRRAREVFQQNPGKYFYADQYSNPANPRAHYETTAPEIWRQAQGRVTHFVAGLGTSGTFVGVTRKLQELNPAVRAISVQPDDPFHGLEGLKHMATAIVPAIYDASLADANMTVRTEDAYAMLRRLAREEGILAGVSSGAALSACLRLAETFEPGKKAVIVTIFPDSGMRYLSERFWEEQQEK